MRSDETSVSREDVLAHGLASSVSLCLRIIRVSAKPAELQDAFEGALKNMLMNNDDQHTFVFWINQGGFDTPKTQRRMPLSFMPKFISRLSEFSGQTGSNGFSNADIKPTTNIGRFGAISQRGETGEERKVLGQMMTTALLDMIGGAEYLKTAKPAEEIKYEAVVKGKRIVLASPAARKKYEGKPGYETALFVDIPWGGRSFITGVATESQVFVPWTDDAAKNELSKFFPEEEVALDTNGQPLRDKAGQVVKRMKPTVLDIQTLDRGNHLYLNGFYYTGVAVVFSRFPGQIQGTTGYGFEKRTSVHKFLGTDVHYDMSGTVVSDAIQLATARMFGKYNLTPQASGEAFLPLQDCRWDFTIRLRCCIRALYWGSRQMIEKKSLKMQ